MIKIFDTHCHLQYMARDIINDILYRAKENMVTDITCISTDMECICKINDIISLHSNYNIYSTIGIHPLDCVKYSEQNIIDFLDRSLLIARNIVGIGETGLDDFRAPLHPMQIKSFQIHVDFAVKHNLPIILHTRCGENSSVESLCKQVIRGTGVKVIAHCYGGSTDFIDFLLQENNKSMISFAGNCTYRKADNLRDLIIYTPIQNMLIETDAPFLPPMPHRGKENESSYIINTLNQVEKLKGPVAETLYNNSRNIFNLL